MTVIELPFPVSVNAMFADGKTRRHKSQRYADWIAFQPLSSVQLVITFSHLHELSGAKNEHALQRR